MRSAFAARMYAAVQLSSQQQMYVPFFLLTEKKLHTWHTHTRRLINALYLGTNNNNKLLFILFYD